VISCTVKLWIVLLQMENLIIEMIRQSLLEMGRVYQTRVHTISDDRDRRIFIPIPEKVFSLLFVERTI